MTVYQPFPWQTTSQSTPMDVYENTGNNYTNSGMNFGAGDNKLGDLISLGYAGKSLFSGTNYKPVQALSGELTNLSNAYSDTSNPLYKKIYGEELQSNQQNLAQAINEAMNQNRKAAALGRVPLFSPERAGETAFRTLAAGYANSQDAARQRAREIIGATMQAKQGAMNAAATTAQAQQANKVDRLLGVNTVSKALPLLLKFL